MKKYYICDVCGRQYESEEEAIKCEKECHEKIEKKKNEEARQEEILNQISNLINEYLSIRTKQEKKYVDKVSMPDIVNYYLNHLLF